MGESLIFWKTPVPLLAPTSEEQAMSWSQSHWPTIYKKCNPFGPHPSIISRSEIEILPELSKWMAMARSVAASCKSKGIGEEIGAIIVDSHGTVPHALALAADARWAGHENGAAGNVMAHAVLRAIGMVAQKLRTVDRAMGTVCESELEPQELQVFMDTPLLPEEETVFDNSSTSPDGYLCHNLDIYLTHEPCIMCSMALLHSRFGRVVIGARMPKTGGLSSETGNNIPDESESEGLGYGLFWRKELNWNMLAWETELPVCPKSESLRSSITHI
jgi:tRNA-specific adenosine deaminase 3